MEKIWKQYKIYIIIGAIAVVAYLWYIYGYLPTQGGGANGPIPGGLYAIDANDEACYQSLVAYVQQNDPTEYNWWQGDISLYMPGGTRSAIGEYGMEADVSGQVSKSMRVLVAMNELQWSAATGAASNVPTAAQAYQATRALYNAFLLKEVG